MAETGSSGNAAPRDDRRREALEGLRADFPRLANGPRDGATIGTLSTALEDQWALTLSGEVTSRQLLNRLVGTKMSPGGSLQGGRSRQKETTVRAEAYVGARASRDAGAPPSPAKSTDARALHDPRRFEPFDRQPPPSSMAATRLAETLPVRERAAAGRDGVVAPLHEPLPRQPLLPAHWTAASDPSAAAQMIRRAAPRNKAEDKTEDEAESEAREDLTQLAAKLKVILDEEARRHGIDV